jgi:hypothetical protein
MPYPQANQVGCNFSGRSFVPRNNIHVTAKLGVDYSAGYPLTTAGYKEDCHPNDG